MGPGQRWAGVIALLALSSCSAVRRPVPGVPATRPEAEPAQRFTDVAAGAGIRHVHHKPVLDHQLDNIMPWVASVGAAAAAGDFNNDGWLDLYVTDSDKGQPNYLYQNNRDGTFSDVAKAAGVADPNGDDGCSMDCIWGDYDNDGWADLYVVRWGRNVLFHNNHDGTFTDVTAKLFRRRDGSAGAPWANGNAAVFLDYNLDGRLDLYLGNYFDEIDLWHLRSTRIMHDDFEKARNAGKNFLYRQEPDGTFAEVGEAAGVNDPGWTLAVGAGDVNNDGWPDLYCADDFGPDQLFLNRGDGTFENVSETALGADTKKGMNADFGDFNNDGWLDIYVANITTAEYLQEGNMLWHNNGPGPDSAITFTDVSLETATYDGGWGWGAKFFDYDADGDLDIIAVNGFISAGEGNYWFDLASWTVTGQDPADARNWPTIGNKSFSGYERTRLWRNEGQYRFSEVAQEAGVGSTRDGRGVVVFDYDNDGDLDLFVANQGQPPHLYRNNGVGANHWLSVRLEAKSGGRTNGDSIGARVTVVTSHGMQIRERDGGNGFCGQSDPRLYFGLGDDRRVRLLEVRWPDGGTQYLEDVAADQLAVIRQDPARYADQAAVAIAQPTPRPRRDENTAPVAARVDPEQSARYLAQAEEVLQTRPASFILASRYRADCARSGLHDRAIAFFKKLSEQYPDDARLRIEWGCALVDKIPTCGGMAAVVCKGRQAREALDQFDEVIKRHPDWWVAYYCRGMNHLHWPRALLHSDAAAADLERCVELQKRAGDRRPHYARTYIALGDAHTKAKHYKHARRAWKEGITTFPDCAELRARLAITDDAALLKFVEGQRSLERPIDTDLSFLDRQP